MSLTVHNSISADNFKDALYSNVVKQTIKDFENLAHSSSVNIWSAYSMVLQSSRLTSHYKRSNKNKSKRRFLKKMV